MAGSFSDFLESGLLAHVFKNTAYAQPTNIYIALCESTVEDDDTGSTLPSECSGGAYARQSCQTWDTDGTQGQSNNDIQITFAEATANWGTATDFAIVDATTGGNLLAYGKLSVAKKIGTGDTAKFATDAITVTLS